MNAIEANLQIGPALMTAFRPSRLPGQWIFPAAMMTMTIQHDTRVNPKPGPISNPKTNYGPMTDAAFAICLLRANNDPVYRACRDA
jgi:hypothetical protein